MKHLLLSAFSSLAVLAASAQCVPETDFGDEAFGVNPDTIVNFAPAAINTFYVQQIDVLVPENGGFVGLDFATVDSASISSISGLPAGLTYECADQLSTPCTFPGGSLGCGVISGIPSQAGVFELDVVLTIYGSFLGTALDVPFPVENYRIVVDGPVNTQEAAALRFGLSPSVPNPAVGHTRLQLQAPRPEMAFVTVFDLVGKKVMEVAHMLQAGGNEIPMELHGLETGIYIYRVDAFGESLSGRFVVSR